MPTYIHNGSAWVEIASTSVTTGPNVYLRTSGSGTVDQNRVTEIYGHDGTTWQKVYQAYVPVLPAKPATPTLSRASGWNSRVDTTKVSWGAISGATGYALEVYDGNYSMVDYRTYAAGTLNSGNIAITPGGNIYYFRLYAYATNDAGTIYSNASSDLRVVSGRTGVSFSIVKANNFTNASYPFIWRFSSSANTSNCAVGSTYAITKSGSSADEMVPGYVVVTGLYYELDDNGQVGLASSSRYIRETGAGLAGYDYSVGNGYGQFVNTIIQNYSLFVPGGGTYQLQALGTGWSSTGTGCTAGSASAVAANMTVSGYETTANTA